MSLYLYLHTAPDSRALARQPCNARCWPKGTFIMCSRRFWVLHRESSDLSPWTWSLDWQVTPPHLQFFCSASFLFYFWQGIRKAWSLLQICVRPGSSRRSKWKHFPGSGTTLLEPQWQRRFLSRERSFEIPPEHLAWEKGIPESPQLLPSLLQYPTKNAGSQCLHRAGLEQGMVKV